MHGLYSKPRVRITACHFTAVRMVMGCCLAIYFIGMHIGYSRLRVTVPLAIPRGGELQDFFQSFVLAANASTWFCITGVAASLLLALGYYRRVVSVLLLLRLLVVIYGHWLQALSIIFPVSLLLWFVLLPHGEPWALLQRGRAEWRMSPATSGRFWLSASLTTGIFLAAALILQMRLVGFQSAHGPVRLIKWAVLGCGLAAVLAANPWLSCRQRTRGITWAVNLVVISGLALIWFSDRELQLLPRLWLPWGLSTCGLYFLLWIVLLDHGLLPGRPATPGKQHIVFYDGLCPLCNAFVRLLLQEDENALLHFAPLQGSTAKDLLGMKAETAAGKKGTVIYARNTLEDMGTCHQQSDAVIHILRDIGGFYAFLATLGSAVPSGMRDFVYRRIAAWRGLFGKHDSCPTPPARVANRFLP